MSGFQIRSHVIFKIETDCGRIRMLRRGKFERINPTSVCLLFVLSLPVQNIWEESPNLRMDEKKS